MTHQLTTKTDTLDTGDYHSRLPSSEVFAGGSPNIMKIIRYSKINSPKRSVSLWTTTKNDSRTALTILKVIMETSFTKGTGKGKIDSLLRRHQQCRARDNAERIQNPRPFEKDHAMISKHVPLAILTVGFVAIALAVVVTISVVMTGCAALMAITKQKPAGRAR